MVFVIAEAGVNHNGDENLALELCDIAKRSGADAVKFQTFTAEELVVENAEKAEYQKESTGKGSQLDMLKKLEMSPELHLKLIQKCSEIGIEFMSTAFDKEALDFLISHGMKRIKIPSGEITNTPFLRYIASRGLPIIMSTGMATLEEIVEAKGVIEEERARLGFCEELSDVLTILHCTSNYPAKFQDVNLNALETIAQETQVPVGYSDHTLGIAISPAAVAKGAVVIEKHFSKSRELPGPDHRASLEENELRDMVSQIRAVSEALGSNIKQPTESELPVRALVRRSVTLLRDIAEGDVLTEADYSLKRPGTGIQPKELDELQGKKAATNLKKSQILQWKDVV